MSQIVKHQNEFTFAFPIESATGKMMPLVTIDATRLKVPAIRAIANLMNSMLLLNKGTTFGQLALADLARYQWRIQLAWTLKHQTKLFDTHEQPFTFDDYKKLKLEGSRVNALLELCFQCYEFLGYTKQRHLLPYSDYGEMFQQVVLEEMNSHVNEFVKDLDEFAEVNKSVLTSLKKEGKNPFPANDKWQHHYNLFALALSVNKVNRKDSNQIRVARAEFRKTYKRYLELYGKTITEGIRDSAFGCPYPNEEGGVTIRVKRTKNQPANKKFFRNERGGLPQPAIL